MYVRADGSDDRSGLDEANAVATVQYAVDQLRSGGTVDIGPGTFAVVHIQSIDATQDSPLVLRGSGRDATWISSGSYNDDAGIEVTGSSNVVIQDLGVRTSLWGIRIRSSNHVVVRDTLLEDLGQEALSVSDFSSQVQILDNVIRDTGLRPGSGDGVSYNNFGEGIYIGTGSGSAKDAVNNVVIRGNDISRTSSEAIDLKPFTNEILVEDNLVHDLQTSTSGALVVGIGDDVYDDPNVVIRNNRIWNIGRTSPYTDGNGIVLGASAEVYNNVIYGIAHRGIFVNGSFANPDARSAYIHHNTVVDTGRTAIEIADGPLPAQALVINNIGTNLQGNIAATLELFVDPEARDYRLAPSASAAIDAGVVLAGAPEFDALGIARPQGAGPDLGAYESAS